MELLQSSRGSLILACVWLSVLKGSHVCLFGEEKLEE
jgi:hypothetical protein